MFPNIRLLIGALFITVLVLSCEFGVFAALRVNREPLNRLTSESAPLQLVGGKNASPAVPIAWSPPANAQAPAGDTEHGIAIAAAPAAQPAERAIVAPAPRNDGMAGTLNNNNQTSPGVLPTALAPPAAAPAVAPVADAAARIAQAPLPPPTNSPAHVNEAAPAHPGASGAPAQVLSIAAADGSPAQPAAAPAALAAVPAQQTPAPEVVHPTQAQPPQAEPAAPAHETAAPASEPPAAAVGGAPVIAAIAPAAAELAAQPAEITGSVQNAAIPESAAPKIAPLHAKPLPKVVHKPAAKKPHKAARAPAQPHHVKNRVARRSRPPAASSSAQPVSDFNNPVFQSAPQSQRQTRRRAGAKATATNNSFSNTFGGQFGTQ